MVSPKVNVGDTVAMLPKSRRALTIQEIAALARSSLHGISQVVKDHVTKPTAMAQGRVAHLIEWKGWSKPSDSPAALESAFSSYSDLSEGEQEARFAAGVAEQFAIAEAKLRAWSSVDGEDSTDDSYDEDFAGGTDIGSFLAGCGGTDELQCSNSASHRAVAPGKQEGMLGLEHPQSHSGSNSASLHSSLWTFVWPSACKGCPAGLCSCAQSSFHLQFLDHVAKFLCVFWAQI
ncbi:protein FAM131A isoform X3 [Otolemur garnettii]|uniref:protein FAM131A isoform X3 n=1 Tax=Otolemur garnettii TaxID=30611 RepID=UPI000C7F0014|nr:protein FAM131A isoform X3 [Otolemur garnettii]